ncbi:sugar transferase, partial [Porphyromonas somerae]
MWVKWIFDRVMALVGLVVLSPLLAVVALLIAIKMPGGPVLFRQKRVG